MATVVIMPRQGQSVESCIITAFNKKVGDVVEKGDILSTCGWSPFEGETFNWKVCTTWVNGECVYENGKINDNVRGRALRFLRGGTIK